MMMNEYFSLGIDYGTLSARAVLCRVSDGSIAAEHEYHYPHGVMRECLPDGTILPPDWALAHPADYIQALYETVQGVMKKSGIPKEKVIGLGIDVTGSTPIPLDHKGQPLCFTSAFQSSRNAYIKLWKHHAASWEAEKMNDLCRLEDQELLASWGGKINSEVLLAKLWQVLREEPAVYAAIDRYVEAGAWLTQMLTGNENLSLSMAIHKAGYRVGKGYPVFFEKLDPKLKGVFQTKLRGALVPLGKCAGKLIPEMAEKLGLPEGIPVACTQYDGLAALPAVGILKSEAAILSAGTSASMMFCTEHFCPVEGACIVARNLILPDLFGCASGQSAFGDLLAWFVDNCVPAEITDAARAKGVSIHQELTERAAGLKPGQSGLIALDWWNGNRSILADANLSGMLIGFTLKTKPEEIYRALLEALAFGARRIIEAHKTAGATIPKLYVTGGISWKNPLMMQILSTVTHLPLQIALPLPAPAIGMAIFAAAAAGKECHGYDSLKDAIQSMNCLSEVTYAPKDADRAVYDMLYAEYCRLHDDFGRGMNPIMHRLKHIMMNAET